jgi:endoglycosylceramidase
MTHFRLAVVALFLAASCTGATDIQTPPEPAGPRYIREDDGRVFVFHGMNFVSAAKSASDRIVPLTTVDLDRLERWGFNAVRYLVFWDAIEPAAGRYDDAYLARVRAEFDKLQARGIRVIIDFHQDVYSQVFCCDGAPAWAVRDDGLDFTLQEQWFMNYLEPAVMRSWDNFWAYTGGKHADLQDHYFAMLAHTAEKLGDHPAVLGFDIMNEPHPGSYFELGETLGLNEDSEASQVFDREFYTPFLQRAVNALRTVNSDAWLFFEARYGGPGAGSKSHIGPLTDPRTGEPRLFYFPHMYSLVFEATGTYEPAKDKSIENWEKHRLEEAAALGTPLGIGEFGFDHNLPGGAQFIDQLFAVIDRGVMSWTYWSYDPGGWGLYGQPTSDGTSILENRLVRTYARRIAGRPVSSRYEPASGAFELVVAAERGVSGATEIWIPAKYYPNGYSLEIPGIATSLYTSEWDAKRQVVSVTFASGAPTERTTRVGRK